MASIETESNRVILHDGGTTLTLDRAAGQAVLQRKLLLWDKKPVVFPLTEIDDIAVKSEVDAMSGATLYHSVMHRRSGEVTVLTTEPAKDAEATVTALRSFVGL
jgi:hypothetical protein